MIAESVRIEAVATDRGATIPRPLTHIERAVLRAAEFYVSMIRRDLNGTGDVTVKIYVRGHKIKDIQAGVQGPREDV